MYSHDDNYSSISYKSDCDYIYDGDYVYDIDMNNKLQITHKSDSKYPSDGGYAYDEKVDQTPYAEAILDLIFNCNIHPHAKKHYKKPKIHKNWKAKKDTSYWSKFVDVPELLTEHYFAYRKEIVNFVTDNNSNVLELKFRTNKPTGYLCKKGSAKFYKVYWFCAIIQKTKDGLITKTCYPCEDPYKKK